MTNPHDIWSNSEFPVPRASRVRYRVLGFLCAMAFVLYLDRICIALALVPMQKEFQLSNTQTSFVLMSFTVAYGLFEIPAGRWGDRYGSRRILTRIVLWWSLFTALTGAVWKCSYMLGSLPLPYPMSDGSIPLVFDSLILLVIVRFLFGAGEAGAYPNAARIMVRWFPLHERGRIQGAFQASSQVGGTIAPVLAAYLIAAIGWRWTFVVFGGVGAIWAVSFYRWFRDQPIEHPDVNAAELQWIAASALDTSSVHEAIPWRGVIRHPNIWLLSIIIILTAFNSYLFFSWYPAYLQKARALTSVNAGWLAALVLAGSTLGALAGGYLADRITRHHSDPYRARRRLCLIVFLLAALALTLSVQLDSPVLSAVLCAIGCLLMFCQQATWWACAFDVGGRHLGAIFGLLNSAGVVGAVGSQLFFGVFADWRAEQGYLGRDQWDPGFYLCSGFLMAAGILWQFVYPGKPVDAIA